MKTWLIESSIGIFALNESGKIIADSLFKGNETEVAAKLKMLRDGNTITELSGVLERLKKDSTDVIVDQEHLRKSVEASWGGRCAIETHSEVIEQFRRKLPSVAVQLKFSKTEKDYESFVRQVTLETARVAVGAAGAKRDIHAIQAVRAIDDLDKVLNLFATRIREWYGLHFPELDRTIDKHEPYVRIVSSFGPRANMTEQKLVGLGLSASQARSIANLAQSSMGAEASEEDLKWLRDFCQTWLECSKAREKAERYTEQLMAEVAPNLASLAGPLLGARLLSIAGGLKNLAKLPASTVQVLGAEKALFRSFRSGARPPKHGIIFQHGSIHQSPRSQRGKIARALSGKLSIAARLDQFGGEFMGEDLKSAFEARVKSIAKG
ncbi:MAG: C/D box methylation guide ribonucleoprotein complex aNOP56 subunit [archaeon]